MKKIFKYIIYVLIVILAVFADQITKLAVENTLKAGESMTIIPKFFRFTYIHNTGAAFGMLSGKTIYLVIFSILVVGFILYQFYVYRHSTFISASFALLLGGLFGNLYDRITFGYVRDFIDFTIVRYDAPIFNVSDICICVSILFIIFNIYKYEGVSKDVKAFDYEGFIRDKIGSVPNNEDGSDKEQHNKTHKTGGHSSK